MYKIQEVLIEKFLNDEISEEMYNLLNEEIINEINVGGMVKGAKKVIKPVSRFFGLSKKIRATNISLVLQKAKVAKMPAGPQKTAALQKIAQLEKRLSMLKKVKVGSYATGGAAVVGGGVASASAGSDNG